MVACTPHSTSGGRTAHTTAHATTDVLTAVLQSSLSPCPSRLAVGPLLLANCHFPPTKRTIWRDRKKSQLDPTNRLTIFLRIFLLEEKPF